MQNQETLTSITSFVRYSSRVTAYADIIKLIFNIDIAAAALLPEYRF